MSSPTSWADFLALDQIEKGYFRTKHPTQSNTFRPSEPFGFGGCTLAFAVTAAYATVSPDFRIFSCLGSFTGPAFAGMGFSIKVEDIRDTRAFATRQVKMYQTQRGKERLVMSAQVDFQVPEQRVALKYSSRPSVAWSSPEESWSEADMRARALKAGMPEKIMRFRDKAMACRKRYFEIAVPRGCGPADTIAGIPPDGRGDKKQAEITEQSIAYWWRSLEPMASRALHAAALAFLLDAGMAMTPPLFAAIELAQIEAAVSLDFAMRFFTNDFDARQWHLREEKAVVANEGRTFNEAKAYDVNGNMIATMSQQCLLRLGSSGPSKASKM